ncbi:ZDHHC5 [Symbiodinium pilosum]|uniref:Palmitoyltransferase n=1 Tax=Symbiodinium pilosum TaxID=2952 RepID=A0A812NNQ0_SYMPI|nr:ZDHHC5 [Symbiodinium pilosum]
MGLFFLLLEVSFRRMSGRSFAVQPMHPMHPTLLTSRPPTAALEAAEEGKAPLVSESDSENSEVSEAQRDYVLLGFDFKPWLPQVFMTSTVLGSACLFGFQLPLLCTVLQLPKVPIFASCGVLAAATFASMGYSAAADPGQIEDGGKGPARSHKSWQYPRPIRRHDHYCKWINNVIGLRNHRPFILMLAGLTLTGMFGLLADGYLTVVFWREDHVATEVGLLLHAMYSAILLYIVVPIVEIHAGLISRNELAQEWQRRLYWVANCSLGLAIPASAIDDVELYNELFDSGAFFYDPARNPYDNGLASNCASFWCTPRWSDTPGDF